MGTKSKWKNGKLHFYDDKTGLGLPTQSVVDEGSIVITTAAGGGGATGIGTLIGYGLSVISSTINGTYTLGVPIKGVIKDIQVGHDLTEQSSFVATVRFSSVENLIRCIAPTNDKNSVVLTAYSSYPACVSLRGVSSVYWALTAAGGVGTSRSAVNGVALSSACT